MDWYVADKEYIQYLYGFDHKVGKVEYGNRLIIYLLQKEKKIIDEIEALLKRKAKKLYNKFTEMPESSLAKRCCDFVLLQEKAAMYSENK